MEEDKEDILNIEDLTNKDSVNDTIGKAIEEEQNMMSNATETNENFKNKLNIEEELTPEQQQAFISGDPNDNDTEEITQDLTTNDDNNEEVIKAVEDKIKTLSPALKKAKQESNLSVVIELLNSIAGLLLAAPVDYKNNVISSFADDIADMRDNGRRIFRDKEQVLTFLNGILSGSLHRQPQRVKESVKNDTLTRNKILNPKLKNRKPRPFTKKNNYVYKGNSLKTVI